MPGTIATSSQVSVTRANNGIFYTSPVIGGGFRGRLAYTMGAESNTTHDLGRLAGVQAEYRAGTLLLTAAAQTRTDLVPGSKTDTMRLKERGMGLEYAFGNYTVSTGYWATDPVTATAGAVDRSKAAWVGGTVRLGAGQVTAQVTRTRIDALGRGSGRAITAGIAYVHSLSKRTSLYTGVGTVRNDANTRLPLNTGTQRVGGSVFDADPRAMVVGMRHDF